MRSMVIPRLEGIATRLQLARHGASVEDLLDASPPTIRLEAQLNRGPWAEGDHSSGVLELSLPHDEGIVYVRTWVGREDSEPDTEATVSSEKLDGSTVDRLALTFLEALLRRA